MTAKHSIATPSAFRLLTLSPTPLDSTSIPLFVPFLEATTGSKPPPEVTTFAGYTSHPPLRLRTKYYQSDVGIWCDELPPASASASPASAEGRSKPSSAGDSGLKRADAPDGQSGTTGTDGTEDEPSGDASKPPSLEEWKSQILSPEAAEVRAVIGGIILLLPISNAPKSTTPSSPDTCTLLIQALHELREAIEDDCPGRDIASLVILQPSTPAVTNKSLHDHVETLEELCLGEGYLGWDFIAWSGRVRSTAGGGTGESEAEVPEDEDEDQRNEFGEKTGIKRVLEVLEGVDWSASPSFDLDGTNLDLDDLNFGDDEDSVPNVRRSGIGTAAGMSSGLDFELQREMMELKMSMLSGDDDADSSSSTPQDKKQDDEEGQIDQLPALLERVVAIREAGAEMSKDERERFARREIARIMREMG